MPVLDSSFLIRLEAEDPTAIQLLRDLGGERLFLPSWVAVEFLTHHDDRESVLRQLAGAFAIVHSSDAWIVKTATFREELLRRGIRFRNPDFWIASVARFLGTSVVTQNTRHFAGFGIPIRSW